MKKLSELSIADLIALLKLFNEWGVMSWHSDEIKKELEKRISQIEF